MITKRNFPYFYINHYQNVIFKNKILLKIFFKKTATLSTLPKHLADLTGRLAGKIQHSGLWQINTNNSVFTRTLKAYNIVLRVTHLENVYVFSFPNKRKIYTQTHKSGVVNTTCPFHKYTTKMRMKFSLKASTK